MVPPTKKIEAWLSCTVSSSFKRCNVLLCAKTQKSESGGKNKYSLRLCGKQTTPAALFNLTPFNALTLRDVSVHRSVRPSERASEQAVEGRKEGGRKETMERWGEREKEPLRSNGESEVRAKGVITDGRPLIAALEKSTCSLMSRRPFR